VALVRVGAVTHSVNMEQRYIPLSFSRGTASLTATAPANANIAPPGFYMLFIIDANGVPSVARMVQVLGDSGPAVTLTQPANGATFTAPATVAIAATANDSDGTVAKVEFFNGATKLGEDTTAPYDFTWGAVPAGNYTVTARATDNLGASTTSSPADDHGELRVERAAGGGITSPADGAVFAWKPTITIAATAGDSDGSVTRVEFLDGTTVIGSDTSSPYSYTWRNVPQGSHSAPGARHGQRRRRHDEQPRRHHGDTETTLSADRSRRRRRLVALGVHVDTSPTWTSRTSTARPTRACWPTRARSPRVRTPTTPSPRPTRSPGGASARSRAAPSSAG
jgi:hypothetical protein